MALWCTRITDEAVHECMTQLYSIFIYQGSQRFPKIKFHDFSMNLSCFFHDQSNTKMMVSGISLKFHDCGLFLKFHDFSRSGKCFFHFPGFP